ncbi:UDP-glucose 4-epimerase GalE [Pseudoalteromonas shioyasakiensis]|uniref:UDP-glucose 4-epimerase GalE n=1 Tax=Pseudoalteromonas TaxID=53246 RepID=UPI000C4FD534|nr:MULTISPECIES: UDP-glucose 4-epimerase GalE [Pseudoalteromonas]MAB61783.1 UDP-glucose 4-epimerase GalE [Pseudoalteromonas sp.]MCG9707444.1 UDP-glucose 4-epimerase GalE [Pseudoalteromonas sp. Isolate3]MCP4588214.1 UDP-glucose 4-epimerase GalE [Pseudoalteromonas sp.]MCQ8883079.1 UDP-glucose 4-epimerase GalE [Pseudoalteromonas shioyasakiensis]NIZ07258.1 UDP-glucose 4-epimerase GalE [Pseudoalteromonas sp. HF66]|tara:strand:- start:6668 stop:7681 length:1014 start_codon:yes stop_codon:yes gene_type:complete
MTILVTGGAGYIGSHTVLELLQQGTDVVVLDNLSNSSNESLARVKQITGKDVTFYQGDILDRACLDKIFREHAIDSVIHFAGLKAVGESVVKPIEYYQNNVQGTLTLVDAMRDAGVFKLVFSSSATVYGDPASLPIREDFPVGGTTNPYGTSKLMVEMMLQDIAKSDERFAFVILRYFNPVGAHESGLIGEDPNGIPNNLLPYISQVAVGKLAKLGVFGDDYDTVDGTGVRDYIHVVDLALGHLKALNRIATDTGAHVFNLGTGNGYSVLQMVTAFEKASGQAVPYQISPRRAGDIAACYAAPEKALKELGWQAERGIDEMMQDTWRWQSNNPNGYK